MIVFQGSWILQTHNQNLVDCSEWFKTPFLDISTFSLLGQLLG